MTTKELRQKTENELKELIIKKKKEVSDTVSNLLQKKEKDLRKPGFIKKEIAQILTVLNEKKILNEETK